MTNNMQQYILSVIGATIICSLINQLIDSNSTCGSLLKMMTGIVFSIVLVSPVLHIPFNSYFYELEEIESIADTYVQQGATDASNEIQCLIKSNTESYILDKAYEMGLDVTIEIVVDSETPPKPVYITITGQVSPYSKHKLQNYITETLAIPKENQLWISQNSSKE